MMDAESPDTTASLMREGSTGRFRALLEWLLRFKYFEDLMKAQIFAASDAAVPALSQPVPETISGDEGLQKIKVFLDEMEEFIAEQATPNSRPDQKTPQRLAAIKAGLSGLPYRMAEYSLAWLKTLTSSNIDNPTVEQRLLFKSAQQSLGTALRFIRQVEPRLLHTSQGKAMLEQIVTELSHVSISQVAEASRSLYAGDVWPDLLERSASLFFDSMAVGDAAEERSKYKIILQSQRTNHNFRDILFSDESSIEKVGHALLSRVNTFLKTEFISALSNGEGAEELREINWLLGFPDLIASLDPQTVKRIMTALAILYTNKDAAGAISADVIAQFWVCCAKFDLSTLFQNPRIAPLLYSAIDARIGDIESMGILYAFVGTSLNERHKVGSFRLLPAADELAASINKLHVNDRTKEAGELLSRVMLDSWLRLHYATALPAISPEVYKTWIRGLKDGGEVLYALGLIPAAISLDRLVGRWPANLD